MANYFDEPDIDDDGSFVAIHFNQILPPDHPACFIRQFIANCDISTFEKKYCVGDGQAGRPPKGVRMMLGILLYAIYCRMYSAHQIEKATHTYADFWYFTHGKRISHDVISEFINKHAEDMKILFGETIRIAEKNDLLDFSALYVDGFMVKANASKEKNYTLNRIEKSKSKLKKALSGIIEKLQDSGNPEEIVQEKSEIEKKLLKISELQEELNQRIEERQKWKRPDKIKDPRNTERLNSTDKDSSLMKMKDNSYANAYLKINALDGRSDIVVGSVVEGHFDESHNAVKVFNTANDNCASCEKQYKTVCFDSGFNTLGSCVSFKAMDVAVIAPTKNHENEARKGNEPSQAITRYYDEETNTVMCSEGVALTRKSEYVDAAKGTVFQKFWNIEGCHGCKRLNECTKNRQGYFQALVDVRQPVQQEVLDRYLSEEGNTVYCRRSHVAETYQGDLKKNGNFTQFFKRGLPKVRTESLILDTVWNLRRIFTLKGMSVAWC